jgi:hypothetical protein
VVTKRLQVLLDDDELVEIRRIAGARRQSVAEWVRGVLREARAAEEGSSVADKLAALHAAMTYRFPAGPIEQMLDEIEQGYLGEP